MAESIVNEVDKKVLRESAKFDKYVNRREGSSGPDAPR
jgi:hypothetical protein